MEGGGMRVGEKGVEGRRNERRKARGRGRETKKGGVQGSRRDGGGGTEG